MRYAGAFSKVGWSLLRVNLRCLVRRRPEKVPPAGFEPATCALGMRCSIQLSYEGVIRIAYHASPLCDNEIEIPEYDLD